MKQRILQSKLLEDSDVSSFFLLWSVLSWQAQETITKPIAIQWIIPRHRTFLFGPQHPLMSLPPCSRVSHCAFLLSPEHPLLSSSLVHGIPSRLPLWSTASPHALLLDPGWVYSMSLHWRYMFLAPYKAHSFLHWMAVAPLSKLFLLWYEAPVLHFLFCSISVRLTTRTPNDLLQLWTKFSKPRIWVFHICPFYLCYFD